jgi:UDP-glucose 4-epimerase
MLNDYKHVIVTGGLGFIGGHLVQSLLKLGKQVTILNHVPPPGTNTTPPPGVRLITADIRDPSQLGPALQGADLVFHTAANASGSLSVTNPRFDFETNTVGTFNIAEASLAAGVKRMVYFASASVYGIPRRFPMDEEHPKKPFVPYGASKLMGEYAALSFFHSAGLEVVVGRPFCVYGVGENPKLALVEPSRYLRWHLNHRPIQIVGDIDRKTRDFVHVSDLVNGMIIIGDRAPAGEIYNIGCGQEISMRQLCDNIGKATGRQPEIHDIPEITEDTYRLVGDITKIRALGYEPKQDMVEALREIAEDLGEYPELPGGETIFKRGQHGEAA